jgi:hypothetical protein
MLTPCKKTTRSGLAVAAALTAVLAMMLTAQTAAAQSKVDLPFEEEGTIDGAPYRIVVPANWNGTALVWGRAAE